jgi:hypothetical protein
VHDAVSLEMKGIASVAVITSGFLGQSEYQAEMLGVSKLPAAFVKHPVSYASAEEMVNKANDSYDTVLASLTKGHIAPPRWVVDGPQGCGS